MPQRTLSILLYHSDFTAQPAKGIARQSFLSSLFSFRVYIFEDVPLYMGASDVGGISRVYHKGGVLVRSGNIDVGWG